MSSPSNIEGMVVRFELLGTPQDGFDLLGSLRREGESLNKELKRMMRTIRLTYTFFLSLINLPGQGEAVINDDEDDEDMPQLVSSS